MLVQGGVTSSSGTIYMYTPTRFLLCGNNTGIIRQRPLYDPLIFWLKIWLKDQCTNWHTTSTPCIFVIFRKSNFWQLGSCMFLCMDNRVDVHVLLFRHIILIQFSDANFIAWIILLGQTLKDCDYLLDQTKASRTWDHHGEPLVFCQ